MDFFERKYRTEQLEAYFLYDCDIVFHELQDLIPACETPLFEAWATSLSKDVFATGAVAVVEAPGS